MDAPNFLRTTELRKYLQTVFNVTTGHDHDGTNSALIASTNPHIQYFQVEDLSAGGDIADRVLLECPTGYAITLTSAKIISQGTAAGIDDSNTCVVLLENGTSNAIVSKTYDADPAFPAAGVVESLGTLSATYKALAAGDLLTLSVTNGTAANTPLFAIQISYTIAAV
jgi:hypothetical protein